MASSSTDVPSHAPELDSTSSAQGPILFSGRAGGSGGTMPVAVGTGQAARRVFNPGNHETADDSGRNAPA